MISLTPTEYNVLEEYFQQSSDIIFDYADKNKEFELPVSLQESGCLCASAFFAIATELMEAYPPDTELGNLNEVLVTTMELQAIQEYYTNSSHFLLDLHKKKEYTMDKMLGTFAILTGKILNRQWKKLEDIENKSEV